MTWFLLPLGAAVLWAISNHLDKYLLGRYFNGKPGPLMIFSALISVAALPVVFGLDHDILSMRPTHIAILIVSGIIVALALVPYLMAMHCGEASAVIPLFQTIPIFGYVFAYVFLGEQPAILQLLGSLCLIVGAVLISFESRARFQHSVFWLAQLSSFLFAVNWMLFKMIVVMIVVAERFWVTVFWENMGLGITAVFFLLVRSYRKQFVDVYRQHRAAIIGINVGNEIISIVGKILVNFASTLAPLGLVLTVNGFQPLFVFVIGVLLTVFFPNISKERIEKRFLAQKFIAIVLIFVGTYLIYR